MEVNSTGFLLRRMVQHNHSSVKGEPHCGLANWPLTPPKGNKLWLLQASQICNVSFASLRFLVKQRSFRGSPANNAILNKFWSFDPTELLDGVGADMCHTVLYTYMWNFGPLLPPIIWSTDTSVKIWSELSEISAKYAGISLKHWTKQAALVQLFVSLWNFDE